MLSYLIWSHVRVYGLVKWNQMRGHGWSTVSGSGEKFRKPLTMSRFIFNLLVSAIEIGIGLPLLIKLALESLHLVFVSPCLFFVSADIVLFMWSWYRFLTESSWVKLLLWTQRLIGGSKRQIRLVDWTWCQNVLRLWWSCNKWRLKIRKGLKLILLLVELILRVVMI